MGSIRVFARVCSLLSRVTHIQSSQWPHLNRTTSEAPPMTSTVNEPSAPLRAVTLGIELQQVKP